MDWRVQQLINSGMAWRLEGSVGRSTMAAIEAGVAILGPEGVRDYYGGYVPSRHEVKAGTKGSVQYANKVQGTRFRATDFDSGLVERYHAQMEDWDE
jgi:hypothetical protein